MRQRFSFKYLLTTFVVILFCTSSVQAQTTSFTYQGRLTDGGTAANGNYDLQFVLFDSVSGGTQVGLTQTLNTVAVSNGVFTVSLDFGANAFPGASRFLEISTRPSGSGSFTLLTPRQPITSTPYAVRSLNAASADKVTVNGNQAFSVTGIGTFANTNTFVGVGAGAANTPESNGNGSNNSFFGKDAGRDNTTGFENSLFGSDAGRHNTTGQRNSFFGLNAGFFNTTGSENSFFGSHAGRHNTTASGNSFFGDSAGRLNTTGNHNSFFGLNAGFSNTEGGGNSFFGSGVGPNNTTGQRNSFFGLNAGFFNTTGNFNSFFGDAAGQRATGSLNTFIGANADFAAVQDISPSGNRNTLLGARAALGSGGQFSPDNATAIGANARVDQSNSLVLGSINGINNATADTKVGIGTTAPTARLSVIATGDGARVLHLGTERAWVFKQLGTGLATALELTGDDPNNNNKNFVINTQGSVGISTTGPLDRLHVFGDIRVGVTGTNGCLKNNNGGTIAGTCSSDLRFKRDLVSFSPVLQKLTRLQPKYFFWRAEEFPEKNFGVAREAGLVAQEVEPVLPELVNEDAQGFKTVDYNKLPLMLLQAVKELKVENEKLKREQQAQIEKLQQVNAALNARLHKVERALQTKSRLVRRR